MDVYEKIKSTTCRFRKWHCTGKWVTTWITRKHTLKPQLLLWLKLIDQERKCYFYCHTTRTCSSWDTNETLSWGPAGLHMTSKKGILTHVWKIDIDHIAKKHMKKL